MNPESSYRLKVPRAGLEEAFGLVRKLCKPKRDEEAVLSFDGACLHIECAGMTVAPGAEGLLAKPGSHPVHLPCNAREGATSRRPGRAPASAQNRLQISLRRGHRHNNSVRRVDLPHFTALAQFERRLIQERTRAGLEAARARGRLGGRKPIAVDDPRVIMAKKMHADKTVPIASICSTLRISRATLYRYLAMK